MMRNVLNYIVDMLLLAMGLLCAITGVVKWPGLVYTLGMSYASLPMDLITWVHDWTGLAIGILALMHVALHLKWLKEMTLKVIRGKRGVHDKA